MFRIYTIEQLAEIDCTAASFQFSTAGADVLTLDGLTPQWAADLDWQRWDKIMIVDGGVPVFIGTVTEGRELSAQGGSAPSAAFTVQSDWWILERTVFTAVRDDGTPSVSTPGTDGSAEQLPPYDTSVGPDGTVYKRFYKGKRWTSSKSSSPTASTNRVLSECFNYAANWTGSRMTSSLGCTLSGQTIPFNQTGALSCAQLMMTALEWTPNAVIRMGYSEASPATGGDLVMHIDESADLDVVTIGGSEPHTITRGTDVIGTCDGVTDISLRPRPDLVLPAAALIGAQHFSIGGDVREPGAFVYCVTRNKPDETEGDTGSEEEDPLADNVPAYTSPDEKKTIISGLPLPSRTTLNGDDYTDLRQVDDDTHKLLSHYFPLLDSLTAPGIGGGGLYSAGAPLLTVATKPNIRPNVTIIDKDAGGDPANYDTAFLTSGMGVYVLTEGSFPASHRASRNIPGLKWCKADLRLYVAIDAPPAGIPKLTWESFFTGRNKSTSGKVWRYAELSIPCTLINSARRTVKGTKPLENDPWYSGNTEEAPDNPDVTPGEEDDAEPDYKSLLTAYYNASQTLCHEGSITLQSPTVRPADLLGRCVRVTGLAPEWQSMTSICRAISYNAKTGDMTLQLGSREVLGFDMLLDRAEMSLERAKNEREAELVNDIAPTVEDDGTQTPDESEEEEETKEEDELMVEPSVGASLITGDKVAKVRRPFEFYVSGGEYIMQGGSFFIGRTELKIPTTAYEVEAGQQTGTALREGTVYRRKVYQKANSSGEMEWTYDIKPKNQAS